MAGASSPNVPSSKSEPALATQQQHGFGAGLVIGGCEVATSKVFADIACDGTVQDGS